MNKAILLQNCGVRTLYSLCAVNSLLWAQESAAFFYATELLKYLMGHSKWSKATRTVHLHIRG